jgi:predicted ATPase
MRRHCFRSSPSSGSFELKRPRPYAAECLDRCRRQPRAAVLEGVLALLDRSLVRQDGSDAEPRIFMMETIREYARERLDAHPAVDIQRLRHRHAATL